MSERNRPTGVHKTTTSPEGEATSSVSTFRPRNHVPLVGIFSRTYASGSPATVFARCRRDGYRGVHFNFVSTGLGPLPRHVEPRTCREIADDAAVVDLGIFGVSATFNAIHPHRLRREDEIQRACRIIELAPTLGTAFVTICTGSRDPIDMWRGHPENASPAAWRELLATVESLRASAAQAGVTLGIEPDPGNVISTPERARALIDELGHEHLGIVLDPANLIGSRERCDQTKIVEAAVESLAPWIAMFHAKDRNETGECAIGRGWIDFDLCMSHLAKQRFSGPVVVHGISEATAGDAREIIESAVARAFR